MHATEMSNFIWLQPDCKKSEIAVTNVTLRAGLKASEQPAVIPCRNALKNCNDALSFCPADHEWASDRLPELRKALAMTRPPLCAIPAGVASGTHPCGA